jgi:uncharacterized membrane protein
MRVRASVDIARPIDEVFAYVADYANDPAWRAEVRDMRFLSDGPPGVGSRVRETAVLWGRRVVTESVITAHEPNRRVAFEAVAGPFRVSGSRTVEAVEDGTRLTYELEWRPGSRAGRLIAPAMGRSFQRTLDGNVERLRTIVEASVAP